MWNRAPWIGTALGFLALAALAGGSPARAQQVPEAPPQAGLPETVMPESVLPEFERQIASGEFSAAKRVIESASPKHRETLRRRLATAQATAGDLAAATATAAAIPSLSARVDVAAQLRNAEYGNRASSDSGVSGGSTSASELPGRPSGRLSDAAGGGAIADFDSLMTLIQSTIVPDGWEALGGPSTMAPYRAGIHVDLDGFVRDLPVDRSDSLAALRSSLLVPQHAAGSAANVDWTRPAALRIVSLRQLRQSLLRRYVAGREASAAMQNLAGLSRIQYIFIDDGDLLIAGPVGGIEPAAAPWPRDRESGRTTLGLDLLSAAAVAVATDTAFGCSIDPTAAGLVAASKVSEALAAGTQPPATAADALADALGPQTISLYGTPADRPLAWLLVDADRHMKQLALGRQPMPAGVPNYIELLEREVRAGPARGVPSGQLLRMWFAVDAIEARRSTDAKAFEISGRPLRLLTAKEAAGKEGERHQAGRDPVGEAFAETFTNHFEEIAAAYPIYDRLRGVFELTAAMKLAHDHTDSQTFAAMVGELALPEFSSTGGISTPRQCDSVAVRHTIRGDRRRHEVYVASGGVTVDPSMTLAAAPTVYPPLDSLRNPAEDRPIENTRWWWDR